MAPNATAIRPPIWAISHAVSAPYFPMCLPPPFYFTKMKKAPTPIRDGAFFRSFLSWRRPTFPHSYPCSIIGPARLNYRVRDGNGCDPRGMITRKLETRERIPLLIPSNGSRVRQQKLCAAIKRPTLSGIQVRHQVELHCAEKAF